MTLGSHKVVQLARGDAENAETYTGPSGELTIETSNWEIRLHDGATVGGRRFLNRDQMDTRYQERSVELDGLLDFEPQQRGYLIRLGPSSFALRSITTAPESIKITNGSGYLGATKLELAPEISSDHTVTGTFTYESQIIADGGLAGDVTGNLTGDSTGHHEGTVTGDVEGDLLGNSFGTHTGSLDTELGEVAMGPGQIQLSYLNDDILDYLALRFVPIGAIIMWSGAIVAIPDSWALCDGTNNTPDLTDRFVVGAGNSYAPTDAGGSNNHSHSNTAEATIGLDFALTIEEHVLTTAELPAHDHLNGVTDQGPGSLLFNRAVVPAIPTTDHAIDDNSNQGTVEGTTSQTGGGDGHAHDVTIDGDLNHTHTLVNATADGRPPYYALAYIMKLDPDL